MLPVVSERFHPFNPGNHLNYRIPPRQPDWYAKYNPTLKVGYECCSEDSISFHYLPVSSSPLFSSLLFFAAFPQRF